MRVFSRVALTLLAAVLLVTPCVQASHLEADCPLRLVATDTPATAFFQSPHGAFRFGNLVFVLRGQVLTTFGVTDLGDQFQPGTFHASSVVRHRTALTASISSTSRTRPRPASSHH